MDENELWQELHAFDVRLDELRASWGVPPPATLFHYTSGDGIKGIIGSGKLWATSIYHLNDSSEFEYGLDIASNALDEMASRSADERLKSYFTRIKTSLTIQKGFIDVYIVCFCEKDNLLSMWRAYAAKGYCIGMTCDGIRPRLQRFSLFTLDESDPSIALEKVEYRLAEQKRLIVQLVEESLMLHSRLEESQVGSLAATVAHQVIRCLARYKNSAFESEEEWRLIKYFAAGLEREEAKFRVVEGLLVPYIEVNSFQGPEERLPIDKIRFGPSLPAKPTEIAIRRLLFAQGYDYSRIQIQASGISLRW